MAAPAPLEAIQANVLDREFRPERPDAVWTADITYLATAEGWLYLAVVMDLYSRRIVGWSMANHLRTDLVLAALEMALMQRKPANVIHHSDQGCQYTSIAFGARCRVAGVRPSMGSVGDCYDFSVVRWDEAEQGYVVDRSLDPSLREKPATGA